MVQCRWGCTLKLIEKSDGKVPKLFVYAIKREY